VANDLVEIYDENNTPLGIQKEVNKVHRDGSWHRAVHVWLYNSKGELILQLRSGKKKFYPNRWDTSAAGVIDVGEEPHLAALRELKEELGISANEKELRHIKIAKHRRKSRELQKNEFCYIYLLKFDGEMNELQLQKDEVEAIRFLRPEIVEKELQTTPEKYVPHGDYWFEILAEIKKMNER
jgi:isopentenyldiphosphate isomerase